MKKNISYYNVAVLFAAGIIGCMFSGPVFAETFIVKDGRPNAEIIISDKPERAVKVAAEELQTYIEKITGAKLAVTNVTGESLPVKIYVGKSKYTDQLKLNADDLKDDAFRMVSGDNYLALLGHDFDYKPRDTYIRSEGGRPKYYEKWDELTGGKWGNPIESDAFSSAANISAYDGRGSVNAVYEFLRGLGVRWYFPGEIGEVVPKTPDIVLPKVDKTVKPDFALRHLYIYFNDFRRGSKDYVMWQLRMGLNEKNGFGGGHGLINVHMRDKSHPEYFALYKGNRATGEPYGMGTPCFSSEGLIAETVKYCQAVFKVYPEEQVLSIAPVDGYGVMCECDLCKGKATRERGWNGMLSDYVWSFMDRVAKEVYKTNPGKKLSNLSYSVYQLPPEKMDKFSPNLGAIICRWRSDFHDPKTRDEFNKMTGAWLEKLPSQDIYIWDYYLHNRGDGPWMAVPVYYPHIIADDLRFLKGKSRGEFIEVSEVWQRKEPSWHPMAANHLNLYVTSRLYWDANQDVDALLAEYYEKFYGPAAKEMKAFIEYAEANWMKAPKSAAIMDKFFELIAAARKAAGDTIYGKRVDILVLYMERLKEVRDKVAKGREKDLPAAAAMERNKTDLKLDGKLDDKFWEGLEEYSLKDVETGNPPAAKTTFRVAWAENSLYFAVRCEDNDMQNLYIAAKENKDANVFNGDNIELIFETPVHSYYQLAFSPAGSVFDMDREGGKFNSLWKSGAEAAGFCGDGFWSLEVRVPVAGENAAAIDANNGIAGAKPSAAAPWYFNLCRQRIRGKESQLSTFSPTGKRSFHELMKFGPLTAK
jgi:hypothetical protein